MMLRNRWNTFQSNSNTKSSIQCTLYTVQCTVTLLLWKFHQCNQPVIMWVCVCVCLLNILKCYLFPITVHQLNEPIENVMLSVRSICHQNQKQYESKQRTSLTNTITHARKYMDWIKGITDCVSKKKQQQKKTWRSFNWHVYIYWILRI